jgi:hypothetical protein
MTSGDERKARNPNLMGTRLASKHSGRSGDEIRTAIKAGLLPAERIAGRYYVHVEALTEWVEKEAA